MHTTRAKRCMKCTVIITVWRKDIEHNTHNIKVVNSGEWYHCSFPVDGKELIPGVAISSLRKKKTDDSREYQIPGLIYSQLFVMPKQVSWQQQQVLQLTGVTPLSDLQWRQLCLNSFSLPANSSSYSCFSQDTVPKTAASLFHPLYKQTRGSLCLGTITTLFNIFLFCNCGYSRISNSLVCRVRILFAVWIFLSYKPCTTSMKSLWNLPQNLSIRFRYS